jgi:YjbE family integral membrane protein
MILDLGIFGSITFDLKFLSSVFSIVIIDLILAGDNAVVIAMAVSALPKEQKMKGIILGAGAAVLLRVIFTFFISQMLILNYVKLIGGILILWISIKLFIEGAPEDTNKKEAKTIWQALQIIVIADITMSIDNMLAVGGASQGNLFLLLFGLGLSMPLILFTSNLLSILIEKYPVTVYIGAAVLGKVGGEMIMTDPLTMRLLNPNKTAIYIVEAVFAVGVIVVGKIWMKWMASREARQADDAP